MAKKTDNSLLLTLSEDEVVELLNIIDAPPEPSKRSLWAGELIILLLGMLALGLIRPGLAAAIVEWATLLLAL
ncbi:MAG: hypothetical protein H7Z12_00955 [Rhodospirillaceae bacterium]|nr:hypothetical protein [Rhodospirillales bacterium]